MITGKFKSLFVWQLLLLLSVVGNVSADEKQAVPQTVANGVLAGQFKKNGKTPLSDGRLFIYNKAMGPPSADRYVRVPDDLGNLDKDGKFSLELPPGKYYLTARVKSDVGALGPPVVGELVYYRMDSKGKIREFNVVAGKTNNVGVISTAVPRKRPLAEPGSAATLIEGEVTDADGAPVAGAVMVVYTEPEVRGKALYVSKKTGADGKFSLKVAEGGTYYLRVRGLIGGGTPKEGEIVSINGAQELMPVTVAKGEKLGGLSIKTHLQSKRGVQYQGNQESK